MFAPPLRERQIRERFNILIMTWSFLVDLDDTGLGLASPVSTREDLIGGHCPSFSSVSSSKSSVSTIGNRSR